MINKKINIGNRFADQREKVFMGSGSFCIYFFYILFIICTEIIDGICFAAGLQQTTIISRILAFILWIYGIYNIQQRMECSRIEWNWRYFAGLFAILLIGCLKSVYPDTGYDTLNYHLIAQKPGFVNYFTEHFGKGNFQVWGFRLGDRCFTLFRNILGYRYGTLLNTCVLAIIDLQVTELLKNYFGDRVQEKMILKVFCNVQLWALIIIFTSQNLMQIGGYYVDLLGVPIGLEMLRKLLEALHKTQNVYDIYYMALLSGIWFAFKLTNIVYIVPFVIMYMILVRKQLAWERIVISGILALSPSFVYFMVNFISTGNPVFPYYNSIFHSQYFIFENFKDERWGATNLIEKILWPAYMVFCPKYRQSEIPDQYTLVLAVGFIGICVVMIRSMVRFSKKKFLFGNKELLACMAFVSSIFWSFTTGYSRYYIFGMILFGLAAYQFIYSIMNSLNSQKMACAVACVASLAAFFQSGFIVKAIFEGREWSWRAWSFDTFTKQCAHVLRDREFSKLDLEDADVFFVTVKGNGIAELLDSSIYTYNYSYKKILEDKNIADQEFMKHKELFDGNIYDLVYGNLNEIKIYVDSMNDMHMRIEEIRACDTEIGEVKCIRLSNQNENPNVLYLGENVRIAYSGEKGQAELSFLCGKAYEDKSSHLYMEIKKENETETKVVYQEKLMNSTIEQYNIPLGNIAHQTCIKIEFYDEYGNMADFSSETNKIFILNPCIQVRGV